MESVKYRSCFKWLLWLFIIHTTCVAIGLIVIPGEMLVQFGFEGYQGRFFQVQAGVFHLVMAVAYILVFNHGEENPWFVYFVVITKSIAAVFLMVYFILVEHVWIILLSAFGDGMMGLLLLLIYQRLQKSKSIQL